MDTDFYLAGGLAFLIALLGWGDRIRNVQSGTRRLERELLEHLDFRWSDLRPLVRNGNPDKPAAKLAAVLRVLKAGNLSNSLDVDLLTELEDINKIRTRLECRYRTRFLLVFFTSVEMLFTGVISNYSLPELPVPKQFSTYQSVFASLDWDHIWFVGCISLVVAILYQTFRLNLDEENLRERISNVDDKLRRAEEERNEHRRKP